MAEGHQLSTCTTLDIKDLNTIESKLNLLSKDKWRSFGLKAGLYHPTLSIIEANHPKDVEGCFRECVSYWLNRSDGVDKEGMPTWPRLGDILEEMGEKALADEIRTHGTSTSLSECGSAGATEPVYTVPYELSIEYSKMNDRFSLVLSKFADEIIEGKSLEDFKAFLLGRSPNQSEGREREGTDREDEIMKVCNKLGLVSLLRKYFFLSNFGALLLFAEEYNFVASQKLLDFSGKIDDLYSKILANDFAKKAIEDHEKKEYHGEVIFKVALDLDTTLMEFQKFLIKAFYRHHGILISLRVVHQSLLTFVCTIPKWLVAEMKEYVVKNEEMLKSKKVVEIIIDGTVMFSIKSKETAGEDVASKLSGLTLSEEEQRRGIGIGAAAMSREEEGKPHHSLENIKRQLTFGNFGSTRHLFHKLEVSMHHHQFIDYFRKFIHTNVEYAELESKVRYHHDIFVMYCHTIRNCQSYSEVKKFCNLFLEVIERTCHPGYVVYQLQEEWEKVLGGEPLFL